MNTSQIAKSTEEQAVASWVNYLNDSRIQHLLWNLEALDGDYELALDTLDATLETIRLVIDTNRGGSKGLHGFIAEVADVGIRNAKEKLLSDGLENQWVNNNGPDDIIRGVAVPMHIQQKFHQKNFSLDAVKKHYEKYPFYVDKLFHRYQIPKDEYEAIEKLLRMSKHEARLLPKNGEDLTYAQWKYVHVFFDNEPITIDDIEPSVLDYKEVQANNIDKAMLAKKDDVKELRDNLKEKEVEAHKPSVQEGAKVIAVAALLEGGIECFLEIKRIKNSGKQLAAFDDDDWKAVLAKSSKATAKGGVRGAGVYVLSNYTKTPGAVASGIMTASFSVAEQVHLFRDGDISEVEFIERAELLCLDTSISALSSMIGQTLIPVPTLGAIIGNAVGMTLYQIAKDIFQDKELEIIKTWLEEQKQLNALLDEQYKEIVVRIAVSYEKYVGLLQVAFDQDPWIAFYGSIAFAQGVGVPTEEILGSPEARDQYFLV